MERLSMPVASSRPAFISCQSAGFTLIEVMIVVAILGIVAALAYPSYSDQVVRSRRAAAAGCVQEAALFVERFRTTNMTYVGAEAALPTCSTDVTAFYTLAAVTTATTFSVTATPIAGGSQEQKDGQCLALSINQRGVRSVSGSASSNPTECWKG